MRPRNFLSSRLILAYLLLRSALCAFAGDEPGQPAPHFRAKATIEDQFNNASVKGKVVLFESWTSWCKYCEAEASMVDGVAKEFADKGLIVLAVDVLEPDQKVKKYLAEHPRSVPSSCIGCYRPDSGTREARRLLPDRALHPQR